MRTLALRIYLTVVSTLLVFALVSGWLTQRHIERERTQLWSAAALNERVAALAELLGNSLPPATEPVEDQARSFLAWAERLRMPMALDDNKGHRIAASPLLADRMGQLPPSQYRLLGAPLEDGRKLWVLRILPRGPAGPRPDRAARAPP